AGGRSVPIGPSARPSRYRRHAIGPAATCFQTRCPPTRQRAGRRLVRRPSISPGAGRRLVRGAAHQLSANNSPVADWRRRPSIQRRGAPRPPIGGSGRQPAGCPVAYWRTGVSIG
ncbi:hypothetical protein chiPu_0028330, partial [Chiloscyllium punctatum]|nr:hypothetical protein [Chiloscyllium punctatum]